MVITCRPATRLLGEKLGDTELDVVHDFIGTGLAAEVQFQIAQIVVQKAVSILIDMKDCAAQIYC